MSRFRCFPPKLTGFRPVEDFPIECRDEWPPGTLTAQKRGAYDRLAGQRQIRPVGVERLQGGRVVVRYRAKIPQEWQRDELRRAANEGV